MQLSLPTEVWKGLLIQTQQFSQLIGTSPALKVDPDLHLSASIGLPHGTSGWPSGHQGLSFKTCIAYLSPDIRML